MKPTISSEHLAEDLGISTRKLRRLQRRLGYARTNGRFGKWISKAQLTNPDPAVLDPTYAESKAARRCTRTGVKPTMRTIYQSRVAALKQRLLKRDQPFQLLFDYMVEFSRLKNVKRAQPSLGAPNGLSSGETLFPNGAREVGFSRWSSGTCQGKNSNVAVKPEKKRRQKRGGQTAGANRLNQRRWEESSYGTCKHQN